MATDEVLTLRENSAAVAVGVCGAPDLGSGRGFNGRYRMLCLSFLPPVEDTSEGGQY